MNQECISTWGFIWRQSSITNSTHKGFLLFLSGYNTYSTLAVAVGLTVRGILRHHALKMKRGAQKYIDPTHVSREGRQRNRHRRACMYLLTSSYRLRCRGILSKKTWLLKAIYRAVADPG